MRRRRGVRAALVALALAAQTLAVFAAVAGAAPGGTPPPTPVNGTPSPFLDDLRTPAETSTPPRIAASAAMLADLDSGDVLFAKAADARRPIASLTKIMTALVVMEAVVLEERVTISGDAVFGRDEYGATSTLGLRAGERRSVRDLLYALMMSSANDAARALAIHVAGGEAAFVERMNERARSLGMRRTRFASATGLDDLGLSSVSDLRILAEAAFATRGFAEIVKTRFRRIPSPRGKDRRIQNRNVLLWLYAGATGAKTGSTAAAGYCLVGTAERDGRRLVSVVLGAPKEAFSDAAALLNHGFEGFTERTLVSAGEALGVAKLRGGSVPVVAGGPLEGLVPRESSRITFLLDVDRDVAFPPAPGDIVGTYRAVAGGIRIGAVPLVVARVPGPPDPGSEPWWVRAGASVAGALASAVGALF